MKYFFAPVQGHTDAAYRHFHNSLVKSIDPEGLEITYTTPFIRLEKGEIRKKDLKDAFSDLNNGLDVIPQVIFKNREELSALVSILKENGASKIDINMGCPFPLQVSRGRGAATISNPECIKAVVDTVNGNPDITFSVKMRLGVEDNYEFEDLLNALNCVTLDHVALHPRTAKSQYLPDTIVDEAFTKMYFFSKNPVVYNGDISTLEKAAEIIRRHPQLHGIMIGRGALGRPVIFNEIFRREEMSIEERLAHMKDFHRNLFTHYNSTLIGGDHQVLAKIQPFWEYAEPEIGRKSWKAIKKASTMAKYQTALAQIQ